MSVSGISSYATAPTNNNVRADFERERLRHAQGPKDAHHRHLRSNDDGSKPSAGATALAGASPDPDAAERAAAVGSKVNLSV